MRRVKLTALVAVLSFTAPVAREAHAACPIGSYPWVDKWGTRICQSFDGGTRYYDTSKGCPTGTHNWVDNWGNKICKAF